MACIRRLFSKCDGFNPTPVPTISTSNRDTSIIRDSNMRAPRYSRKLDNFQNSPLDNGNYFPTVSPLTKKTKSDKHSEKEKQKQQEIQNLTPNNNIIINTNQINQNSNNVVDITINNAIDAITETTNSNKQKILNSNKKDEIQNKFNNNNNNNNNETISEELQSTEYELHFNNEEEIQQQQQEYQKQQLQPQQSNNNSLSKNPIEFSKSEIKNEKNKNSKKITDSKTDMMVSIKKENKISNKNIIFDSTKPNQNNVIKSKNITQPVNNNTKKILENITTIDNNQRFDQIVTDINENHQNNSIISTLEPTTIKPTTTSPNTGNSFELTNELRKQEIFITKQNENKKEEKRELRKQKKQQLLQQQQQQQIELDEKNLNNPLSNTDSKNKTTSKRHKHRHHHHHHHQQQQQNHEQHHHLLSPDRLSIKKINKHHHHHHHHRHHHQQQQQQQLTTSLLSNTHLIGNKEYEEARRNRQLPQYGGVPKIAPIYLEELKQKQKQQLLEQHKLLLNVYNNSSYLSQLTSNATVVVVEQKTTDTEINTNYIEKSIRKAMINDDDESNLKLLSNQNDIKITKSQFNTIPRNASKLNEDEKKNCIIFNSNKINNTDTSSTTTTTTNQLLLFNDNDDNKKKSYLTWNELGTDLKIKTNADEIKCNTENKSQNIYIHKNSNENIDNSIIIDNGNSKNVTTLKLPYQKSKSYSYNQQKRNQHYKNELNSFKINLNETDSSEFDNRSNNKNNNFDGGNNVVITSENTASIQHKNERQRERDSGVQVDEPDNQQQQQQQQKLSVGIRNQQSGEGNTSSRSSSINNRSHSSGSTKLNFDNTSDPNKQQKQQKQGKASVLNPIEDGRNLRKGLFFTRDIDNKDSIEIPTFKKSEETRNLIKKAIENNDFLNNYMDSEMKKRVINAMEPEFYNKGDYIIKENDEGSEIYVSETGEFEVIKNNNILTTLGPGIVFGELAILYNAKRFASIKAKTKAKVWKIDRTKFRNIRLISGSEERKENLRFLKSAPFLKNLPDDVLLKICELLKRTFFPTDTCIIRQGDKGDVFYIIRGNSVTIKKYDESTGQEKIVDKRKRGDYFGEQALLNSDYRLASVYADSPGTECLILDRESFINYLGTIEELLKTPIDRDIQPEIKIPPSQFDFIQYKELKKVTSLGAGAFGVVNLVTYNEKFSFALKVVKKIDVIKQGQMDHIYNEKRVMSICRNSPFIVQLYNTFRDNRYVYFLMEACLGGDVWTIMYQRKYFDEKTARFISGCIVEAFDFLHTRNIIYRDLKPENIMVTPDGYCKLADFGFAKHLTTNGKTNTFAGTPEYVAPEIILDRGHDRAADYWTLGILIYELLAGRTPFRSTNQMRIYQQILTGIDAAHWSTKITKSAQNLIKSLCKQNAAERLGYQRRGILDIKKHGWYDGFDWNKLHNRQMSSPIKRPIHNYIDTQYFPTKCENNDEDPPEEMSGWDDEF